MVWSPTRARELAGLAVVLAVVVAAGPAHTACDPGTDPDKADIANARAAVAASCDCAGATSHGAYVRCAAQQANLALVNKGCAGAVKRCASRSTCGKPGAVTCCVSKPDGTRCKIKRDGAHCIAPSGGTACVGSYASCCDACTADGCATTTTTSTTSTTSTTTTGCGGFPACSGDCGPGQLCLADGRFNRCGCFPLGGGCGSLPWPICGSGCPGGGACAASFSGFCRCAPPP